MLAVPTAAPQIWLFEALGALFCMLVLRKMLRRSEESGARRNPTSLHGIILQNAGFVFVAIGPLQPRLSWFGSEAITAYIALVLLMGTAISLFVWSSARLGKNWSLEARTRQDHELVRTGPYAHVRHPIYLAMLLLLFSMALAFGHWIQLVIALPVFAVGTKMRTDAEEQLLVESFGDEYRNYRMSTPALIPRLN